MRPKWSFTILIAIISIVVGLLIGKGCSSEKIEYIDVGNGARAVLVELENGKLVSQVSAQEVELKSLRSKVKDLSKEVGVRKPTRVMNIETIVKDTVYLEKTGLEDHWNWGEEVAMEERDSMGEFYKYNDKWIDVSLYNTGFSTAMAYTVRDSISFVESVQDGDVALRAISANPNTLIKSMEYLIPKPKVRKIGLGLQSGVTFDGKLKPYLGIGLSWNFVRF